ncbi:unnamed protein product [Polarella glacialis]|uniref:Uncharacterized protein n=1 Tax=Polarella glacialis TaxID=89957 RepID=A0A813JLD6_POLGL|nr:unnamed protein product [Polarella glacialis]
MAVDVASAAPAGSRLRAPGWSSDRTGRRSLPAASTGIPTLVPGAASHHRPASALSQRSLPRDGARASGRRFSAPEPKRPHHVGRQEVSAAAPREQPQPQPLRQRQPVTEQKTSHWQKRGSLQPQAEEHKHAHQAAQSDLRQPRHAQVPAPSKKQLAEQEPKSTNNLNQSKTRQQDTTAKHVHSNSPSTANVDEGELDESKSSERFDRRIEQSPHLQSESLEQVPSTSAAPPQPASVAALHATGTSWQRQSLPEAKVKQQHALQSLQQEQQQTRIQHNLQRQQSQQNQEQQRLQQRQLQPRHDAELEPLGKLLAVAQKCSPSQLVRYRQIREQQQLNTLQSQNTEQTPSSPSSPLQCISRLSPQSLSPSPACCRQTSGAWGRPQEAGSASVQRFDISGDSSTCLSTDRRTPWALRCREQVEGVAESLQEAADALRRLACREILPGGVPHEAASAPAADNISFAGHLTAVGGGDDAIASNNSPAQRGRSRSETARLEQENNQLRQKLLEAGHRIEELEDERQRFFDEGIFDIVNQICRPQAHGRGQCSEGGSINSAAHGNTPQLVVEVLAQMLSEELLRLRGIAPIATLDLATTAAADDR